MSGSSVRQSTLERPAASTAEQPAAEQPPADARPGGERRRGVVIMVVAMVFIAAVDAIAKHLGTRLDPVQVVWGYFLVFALALAATPPIARLPWRRLVASRRPGLQLMRAAVLVVSLNALFAGLPLLPLADATAVSFAAPMFVALLSVPLLGERVDGRRWAAVAGGLLGVAVIVRPGTELFQWAALLPLLGAVFFALFQILTRRLAQIDAPLPTLFYTGMGGLLLTSLTVGFVWRPPAPLDWAAVAAMGGLGLAAHFLMIKAFALAPASLLSPLNYTRIVWALLLGFLLFGTLPDGWSLLGSALIVGSGLLLILGERR